MNNGKRATERALVLGNNLNNDFNINANDNINNNRPARGMTPNNRDLLMKVYKNLWKQFCTFVNLESAYHKAAKGKLWHPNVIAFEEKWRYNLCTLLRNLKEHEYTPNPLKKFILRDPKTRVISVSDFRDRIIHHAIINTLQPIYEPLFIHDSYASRKGKGTLKALQRFDAFKRKVSKNNTRNCYVLKADIKHYFDTVDHEILINIIRKKIRDKNIVELIQKILDNHQSKESKKGMPLGNWTSQFFANIYLNELDQFIKKEINVKCYIRYVDDFVILHHSKQKLENYKSTIQQFLQKNLRLEMHLNKCKIIPLNQGVNFLGFKVFYYHKTVLKRNLQKVSKRLGELMMEYKDKLRDAQEVMRVIEGWNGYAKHGNTYNLRRRITTQLIKNLTK